MLHNSTYELIKNQAILNGEPVLEYDELIKSWENSRTTTLEISMEEFETLKWISWRMWITLFDLAKKKGNDGFLKFVWDFRDVMDDSLNIIFDAYIKTLPAEKSKPEIS